MDASVIVIIVVIAVAFITVTTIWGVRAHRRQVAVGREELLGKKAEAKTTLNPKGTVLIEGELWAAASEGEHIEPGEEVIITKVEGLKLLVRKIKGGKK